MDGALRDLLEAWKGSGVSLRAGASTRQLDDLESKLGLLLPSDFRAYILAVDGMNESDWNPQMVRFWPVDEICLSSDLDHSGEADGDADSLRHLVFADFLLDSHFYALTYSAKADRGPFVSLLGSGRCADDFTEFLKFGLAGGLPGVK